MIVMPGVTGSNKIVSSSSSSKFVSVKCLYLSTYSVLKETFVHLLQNYQKKILCYYLTIISLQYRHNSNNSRIKAKIMCVTGPLYFHVLLQQNVTQVFSEPTHQPKTLTL